VTKELRFRGKYKLMLKWAHKPLKDKKREKDVLEHQLQHTCADKELKRRLKPLMPTKHVRINTKTWKVDVTGNRYRIAGNELSVWSKFRRC